MYEILTFCGTVVVACMSLAGIIIQTKSKERQEDLSSKIDLLRKESLRGDESIRLRLAYQHRSHLKLWLVNELTKVKNGVYIPNEKQKALMHEAKKDYNKAGGDSYVDELFEDCVQRDLL